MVVAEHLGRLKLNGRVFGRARLSDVIELETLFVGITGKLSLWETLSLIGPRPDIDLDALAARARAQRAAVGRCRESASINAFRSPADPHPSGGVSPPISTVGRGCGSMFRDVLRVVSTGSQWDRCSNSALHRLLGRALPPGVLRPNSSNGRLPGGGRPWYTSTISRSSALSPRYQW